MPDYNVHGPESETTLFLLHGAYGAKEYWLPLIETVTKAGFRVVAWDAPGYGISPPPDPEPTIDDDAHAAARLMRATGTQRNVVLGHSMGGLVAQRIQRIAPGITDGLILSSTVHTYHHSDDEWQAEFQRTRVAPLMEGGSIADHAPELLRSMVGPNAGGPDFELVLDTVRRMRTAPFLAAMRAIASYDDPGLMAELTIPTLCLAGELDTTCPPEVLRTMADALPDGRYYEFPSCGHFLWVEAPQLYAAQVLDHLHRMQVQ
jgi:pimeloyl-ACP methyl ester carboxylesterase